MCTTNYIFYSALHFSVKIALYYCFLTQSKEINLNHSQTVFYLINESNRSYLTRWLAVRQCVWRQQMLHHWGQVAPQRDVPQTTDRPGPNLQVCVVISNIAPGYSYSRHSESLTVPGQSTEFVKKRLNSLCILLIWTLFFKHQHFCTLWPIFPKLCAAWWQGTSLFCYHT